jgi:two-component system sensor histidine kinase BaeS
MPVTDRSPEGALNEPTGHWTSRLWVRLTVINMLALSLVFTTLLGFILYRTGVVLGHLPLAKFQAVQLRLDHDFWHGLLLLLEEISGEVFFTLGATVLLAVLSAVLLTAYYARYLSALVLAIRRLATGDFQVRIPSRSGIHELRVLEYDLNRTAARLEHLERERQFESAAMAHELRTPITALRLRIMGIQESVLPFHLDELAPLNIQLDHLDRLAESLLTLTLAEAGRLELDLRPTQVHAFLNHITELFQGIIREKQIRFRIHVDGDPILQADAFHLHKVFKNIVENAVKYTPEGGSVDVYAETQEATVTFRIVDTGPGVPTEALGQLFNRFYRFEASRTRGSGGSGLGLAIASAIVLAHGGELTAQSPGHGGLEVSIRLPLVPERLLQ